MSRIYLAGPISGLKDFNYPAFEKATKELEAEGHQVYNPCAADLDHGVNPADAALGGKTKTRAEVLLRDLHWIADNADLVVVLPNWQKSTGVRLELSFCACLGIPIRYLRSKSKKNIRKKNNPKNNTRISPLSLAK